MKRFAKALDPSISAASFEGAKQGIPAATGSIYISDW
jgi:hypothetical protein